MTDRFFPRDEYFMRLALREAERALEHDDVPVGCVIVLARMPRVDYATTDPKTGAAGSVLDVLAEPRLNHRPEVAGGLLAQEAGDLLRAFFSARR